MISNFPCPAERLVPIPAAYNISNRKQKNKENKKKHTERQKTGKNKKNIIEN